MIALYRNPSTVPHEVVRFRVLAHGEVMDLLLATVLICPSIWVAEGVTTIESPHPDYDSTLRKLARVVDNEAFHPGFSGVRGPLARIAILVQTARSRDDDDPPRECLEQATRAFDDLRADGTVDPLEALLGGLWLVGIRSRYAARARGWTHMTQFREELLALIEQVEAIRCYEPMLRLDLALWKASVMRALERHDVTEYAKSALQAFEALHATWAHQRLRTYGLP